MGELFATFGLNVPLLITQIVNFGILLVGLWWFLYRPAIAMLDERRAKIESGVTKAEQAKVRLEEIEEEKSVIIADASGEAGQIVETAKTRAKEQATEIVGDANTRAESLLDGAQKRADEMKEQALRESKGEIGKAAILAAEQILKERKS